MEPTGSWVFLGGGVGALFRSFGGRGLESGLMMGVDTKENKNIQTLPSLRTRS